MNRQLRWDNKFIKLAHHIKTWSKDPDRQSGAVLVAPDMRQLSTGFNGLPKGVADTEDRLADRGLKNMMTVHAELNAILNAGFSPVGCSLYTTSFPCHECAKGIIQTEVARVVTPRPKGYDHPRWGKSWALAMAMLSEVKWVGVFFYDGEAHGV